MRPLTALAAAAVCALAQQPDEWKIVSDVRLVIVDAGVRNRNGQPVAGIPRGAFRVFDNGKPRPVAAFAPEDAPATIGLVVDASGSMRHKRADLLLAASALLDESNPVDEMFLVTFNDSVRPAPIAPAGALRAALAATAIEGRTALYDGIRAATGQLAEGTRERKSLIVISDGADNASQSRRRDVELQAQLSHATIYTIGILDEGEKDRDPGFLRELAEVTGGSAYIDVAPDQLVSVCRRIAHEIRSRYMLGFYASTVEKTETRRIRVEVTSPPGVRVTARRSYLAMPATGGKP